MPKKHIAPQLVSPVIDPPVLIKPTVKIDGEHARLWREFAASMAEMNPSESQLAIALIRRGLEQWKGQNL